MALKRAPRYYAEKYKLLYMDMARVAARASVARRKQVGCILYLADHTLSPGFNGMPSGSLSEVCEGADGATLGDVVHGEDNAIRKLVERGQAELLNGAICFVTLQPCRACAELIVNAGIEKVYYSEEYRLQDGIEYLLENGVEVERI